MNDRPSGGRGGGATLGVLVGLLVAAVVVIGIFVFSNSGPDDMDVTVNPPQNTAPSVPATPPGGGAGNGGGGAGGGGGTAQ